MRRLVIRAAVFVALLLAGAALLLNSTTAQANPNVGHCYSKEQCEAWETENAGYCKEFWGMHGERPDRTKYYKCMDKVTELYHLCWDEGEYVPFPYRNVNSL